LFMAAAVPSPAPEPALTACCPPAYAGRVNRRDALCTALKTKNFLRCSVPLLASA
jgi:hypothetical protein